jgi:hypothetical protein
MRYGILLASALIAVATGAAAEPGEPAADLAYSPASVPQHVHATRDESARRHGAGTTSTSSAAMTFHGGNVLPHVAARVVLAGAKWRDPAFAADKITGLDSFYGGYGGSTYAATADEYIGANGLVGAALRYQGHDAPLPASVDGTSMAAVANAACAEFASGSFQAETGGTQYIAVYSDMKRPASVKYCAYHGAVSCSRQTVTVAFFWNLDADGGCGAQDYITGHSPGLAALANVTAHELHEARTDPLINAWYDAQQNEVGDKCAWTFASPYVTFRNGSRWKLQAEWSNAAYSLSRGVANRSGQQACVDH